MPLPPLRAGTSKVAWFLRSYFDNGWNLQLWRTDYVLGELIPSAHSILLTNLATLEGFGLSNPRHPDLNRWRTIVFRLCVRDHTSRVANADLGFEFPAEVFGNEAPVFDGLPIDGPPVDEPPVRPPIVDGYYGMIRPNWR